MVKVLRIINRFNLGGPTYNAAYLTRYLPPEFETRLIGGMKDETEDSSEHIVRDLGIEPIIIPEMKRSINFKNDRIAYQKIGRLIQDFKPDIVHTHASKAGAIGRLAAAKHKVPIVVHTFHGHVFHSYFGKLKTNFYKTIERHLASKSHCIVAISDKQKQELVTDHRICKEDMVRVIPLGFDLDRFHENQEEKRNSFRTKYGLTENDIAVGIVGRLVPIKNHRLFLESLVMVLKSSKKAVRGFIIGDGEIRGQIEVDAQALGLSYSTPENPVPGASLVFTSWMRDMDVAHNGLDIVALTSLNEGTPVSLIEAQAAGVPVISTRVGGVENTISHGNTGFIVDEMTPKAFSTALSTLIENDDLRAKMKENGWPFVRSKYHYQRLVGDVAELYQNLLNGRKLS